MAGWIDNKDGSERRGNFDRRIPAPGAAPETDVAAEIDVVTGLLIQNAIGQRPADAPDVQEIVVRRIGILDGDGGPFGFIEPTKAEAYSSERLTAIIGELRKGKPVPGIAVGELDKGPGPLDVVCDKTTIFVFNLVDPAGTRKFRFSRSSNAISLGGVAAGGPDNYYSLHHVVDDDVGTPERRPDKDCRIAYFTARRTEDEFRQSFNIHVEIVYPAGASEYVLPIIIDPDVRYPGGSG